MQEEKKFLRGWGLVREEHSLRRPGMPSQQFYFELSLDLSSRTCLLNTALGSWVCNPRTQRKSDLQTIQ